MNFNLSCTQRLFVREAKILSATLACSKLQWGSGVSYCCAHCRSNCDAIINVDIIYVLKSEARSRGKRKDPCVPDHIRQVQLTNPFSSLPRPLISGWMMMLLQIWQCFHVVWWRCVTCACTCCRFAPAKLPTLVLPRSEPPPQVCPFCGTTNTLEDLVGKNGLKRKQARITSRQQVTSVESLS